MDALYNSQSKSPYTTFGNLALEYADISYSKCSEILSRLQIRKDVQNLKILQRLQKLYENNLGKKVDVTFSNSW